MIFSSISFLFYFLPIVVLIYKFTPTKWKNIILVISSLFFYAWGEPKYVLLMLFSTIVDYTIGLCIGHYLEQANGKTKAKCFMVLSICINLGLLFFFKYTNLIASSIQSILSLEFSIPSVALPIGISFYTFQTMSYSIDVYRRKVAPQKNIIDFATYVTLFPQLIAGPIVRYATVETELKSRTSNYDKGTKLFLLGLAQKVLIANNMGLMWEEIKVLPYDSLGMATSWLGIFAFAIQIFFDFCGYSNMAIGLGYFFGFHFPINFDKPYISKSITEFWHRWHISLSTWFKEYVYIPLGGNRNGLALQIRNILIVWLLTGFWHGASWNFLFWGLYYAILLILEKLFLYRYLQKIPSFFAHLYSIFFVLIGWVLFAFEDVTSISSYFLCMFGRNGILDESFVFFFLNNLVLIILSILLSTVLPRKLLAHTSITVRKYLEPVFYTALFLLSIAYIVDSTYNPFLYFRF